MKELIAYFSRPGENYVGGVIRDLKTGNTETAAKLIQACTGGTLFQLVPAKAYSADYNECIAQAQDDQRRDARPELKEYPDSIAEYDIIYLGYPNYWGTMPMCVFTFLEHFDFTGKTIRPFCTHEGSGLGRSETDLRRLCPGATVTKGLAIPGAKVSGSKAMIEKWLKR